MEACERCAHWTVRRVTAYGNGEMITNWSARDGKGLCDKLSMETDSDFGCKKFLQDNGDHVVKSFKNGAPWQHSTAGPCPDCQGRGHAGDAACHRCAGTGKVRYYDDGFIGEENTRLHPKEAEVAPPLTCKSCNAAIDIAWVACPYCGKRLEPMAETENVGDGNAGGGDFAAVIEARRQKTDALDQQIRQMNERNMNP